LAQSARCIYQSELKNGSKPGYSRLIQRYLSKEHRDNPRSGCVMASIGSELAREEGEARSVYSHGFEKLVTLLAELSPARTCNARRGHFLSVISSLVGALTLARAVNDRDVSDEILASVRLELLGGERRRNARTASHRIKAATA
jgi:TetR/AcrR family transcriptional regulator, transcriptional repressor for nem operon